MLLCKRYPAPSQSNAATCVSVKRKASQWVVVVGLRGINRIISMHHHLTEGCDEERREDSRGRQEAVVDILQVQGRVYLPRVGAPPPAPELAPESEPFREQWARFTGGQPPDARGAVAVAAIVVFGYSEPFCCFPNFRKVCHTNVHPPS